MNWGEWGTIFKNPAMRSQLDAIESFLARESQSANVYPEAHLRYRALELCPLQQTQVIIVGQDPYHGPGQADGLAFSVPPGIPAPPSLQNIIQEAISDPNIQSTEPSQWLSREMKDLKQWGNLESWARQGVLLLNTCLSVREQEAGSHSQIGWQTITRAWIELANSQAQPSVFMLWGKQARQWTSAIDDRHFVIESTHPSPLSAYKGFIGSQPFGKANQWLKAQGRPGVDWMSPWRRSASQL